MSGSAWHFKRFTYLALKVLDAEVQVFHQKMADYISFDDEADFVEDINEDVGDEISDYSHIESENSFIDDQDVNKTLTFTDILQMLKRILNRF